MDSCGSRGVGLACALVMAAGSVASADVLVVSFGNSQINRYDQTTGRFVSVFAAGEPMNGPLDLTYASDGTLWVTSIRAPSFQAANVIQYNGQTGELMRVVVRVTQGGLIGPSGLAFGRDGNLLVCNKFGGGDILKFDPVTGAVVPPSPFIPHSTSPPGGVNAPEAVVIGPDGLIYISENHDGSIRRFDGTGVPVGNGLFGDPLGFSADPQGMAFGPDGHLYVAVYFYDEVWRLDGQTGELLSTISVLDEDLELVQGGPMGVAWGPDGNMYVTNYLDDRVAIFDGATLTLRGVLDPGGEGGLDGPTRLVFMPDQPVPCYANCDGSTQAPVLNVNDMVCFQTRFAAGEAYANCDASTTPPVLNVGDFVCFLGSFAGGCR